MHLYLKSTTRKCSTYRHNKIDRWLRKEEEEKKSFCRETENGLYSTEQFQEPPIGAHHAWAEFNLYFSSQTPGGAHVANPVPSRVKYCATFSSVYVFNYRKLISVFNREKFLSGNISTHSKAIFFSKPVIKHK